MCFVSFFVGIHATLLFVSCFSYVLFICMFNSHSFGKGIFNKILTRLDLKLTTLFFIILNVNITNTMLFYVGKM